MESTSACLQKNSGRGPEIGSQREGEVEGLLDKRNHWKTPLVGEDWAELGPQGIPWENLNFPCIHSFINFLIYSGILFLGSLLCKTSAVTSAQILITNP